MPKMAMTLGSRFLPKASTSSCEGERKRQINEPVNKEISGGIFVGGDRKVKDTIDKSLTKHLDYLKERCSYNQSLRMELTGQHKLGRRLYLTSIKISRCPI